MTQVLGMNLEIPLKASTGDGLQVIEPSLQWVTHGTGFLCSDLPGMKNRLGQASIWNSPARFWGLRRETVYGTLVNSATCCKTCFGHIQNESRAAQFIGPPC